MESQILDHYGVPFSVPDTEVLEKAWKKLPTEKASSAPKSFVYDPMSLMYSLGYKDKQFALTYTTIRQVMKQLSLSSAIVRHRIRQVVQFCTPYSISKESSGLGFAIKHKDSDRVMTNSEKRFVKELEQFILYCGDPRPNKFTGKRRPDFEEFTKKFLKDLLELDQGTFELVPRKHSRTPYEFMAVDAATIRIAADQKSQLGKRDQGIQNQVIRTLYDSIGRQSLQPQYRPRHGTIESDISHIQLVRGQIETLYTEGQMAFCVQNPRTDLTVNGYGESNVELLIKIITAHLYAEQHNLNIFKQGSVPKSLFNIVSDNPSPKNLESFKRQWHSQVAGVENVWKTPFLAGPEIQHIALQGTNQEMEFQNWMNYLIRIQCFPAKTPIIMANGESKNIKDVRPGDQVRSHTGKVQSVVNRQRRKHKGRLICIRAGGEVIKTTEEHPFYVCHDRGFGDPEWVEAKDLVHGQDYLIMPKPLVESKDTFRKAVDKYGRVYSRIHESSAFFLVPVAKVWTEKFKGNVYNLEVENDNSYQVHHFAVHNCAIWGIDPAEIGFDLQASQGQFAPPNVETPQEWKIKKSKDRGLRPLLRFYAHCLSKYIIDRIDDHFYLDFVGLDELDQKMQVEVLQQEVGVYRTVNEAREIRGLPPREDGDIILNPIMLQSKQMEMNQQAMEGGQGEGDVDAAQEEHQQMMAHIDPDLVQEEEENAETKSMESEVFHKALSSIKDESLQSRVDHALSYVEIAV